MWDTPEENTDFGKNSFDEGFGMCTRCGGDPKAETTKGKMGWAMTCFFEARVDTLAKALNEKNRAHFLALPFEKQCWVIEKAITEGMMI
jgi:hypothetical protein